MLDLTDFGKMLLNNKDIFQEDEIYKSLSMENMYLKQELENLKQQMEAIKETYFKEGYEKAKEELKKNLEIEKQQYYNMLEKEFEEKINQQIQLYSENLSKLDYKLNEGLKEILNKINSIISDSLEEILNFLSINYHDPNFLRESISSIIEILTSYKLVKIKVGSNEIENILKKHFPNVEIIYDETLAKNDFKLEFDLIKVENNVKEKIQIVKDEIKREIKKLSEV